MSKGGEQIVLFPEQHGRRVELRLDTEAQTSDAGALLLAGADRRLALTESLAGAIRDGRRGGQVRHETLGLLRQRIFGLAAGYADCNDVARLAADPVWVQLKRTSGRDASALASQPTLSRFENGLTSRDLVALGKVLRDRVIAAAQRRYGARRVRRIVIDLDPTCDRAHGQRQLIAFNAHDDSYCYLPLCAFLSFDGHPESHLVAAVLRSGSCRDFEGAVPLLRRLLPGLRRAFPKARLTVRVDGGFANEEIRDWLEDQPRTWYVANLPRNAALEGEAELFDLLLAARQEAFATGCSARRFGELTYAAKTWDTFRRVIVKGEVTLLEGREPKDNPRFLVTNLRGRPERLYATYTERGDIENRLKELKGSLALDRTSCTRFLANQARVLLAASAYVLLQELRLAATGTACERAQVDTLRLRLLKIGARVVVSVRRLVLHGPQA